MQRYHSFIGFIIVVALVLNSCTINSHKGHAYVDLGLPSGTLWATYNIGASSPEEYGNYYAWGEILGCDKDGNGYKTNFSWNTYTDWSKSDSNFVKYNSADVELALADDVANFSWSGNWRIPTLEQFKELIDNCTTERITQNGVSGNLFTSKKNGNTLFLPSAGCYWSEDLIYDGDYGNYWSRSLSEENVDYVYFLYCNLDYVGWNLSSRVVGLSVRAVFLPERK